MFKRIIDPASFLHRLRPDPTRIHPDPQRSVGGWFGDRAVQFDGKDDYIRLGQLDVLPVDGKTGITLEAVAWIDPHCTADARLISKATSTSNGDHFWMLSSYAPDASSYAARVRLKLDGQTKLLISDEGAIQKGGWAYLAATYDGSKIRIYSNGLLIEETDASGDVSTDDSVFVTIGANPDSAKHWKGRIGEVRISHTPRSSSWIAAQYRAMAPDAPEPLINF